MVLPSEDIARADALAREGRSLRYIAETLGVAKSTIHDALRRFRETGSYDRRAGSGRPRATTAVDDRFITLSVLRDRHLTAPEVRVRLEVARNTHVSADTVRRRLREHEIVSRRPATGPQLLERHRRERRLFADQYSHWTLEQWGTVLFTDESRFGLYHSDDRGRVWRRPGERFAQCTIPESRPFERRSVMVWGGINFHARTELIFINNGALTARRYIEEVLLEAVIPFAPFIGEQFILM